MAMNHQLMIALTMLWGKWGVLCGHGLWKDGRQCTCYFSSIWMADQYMNAAVATWVYVNTTILQFVLDTLPVCVVARFTLYMPTNIEKRCREPYMARLLKDRPYYWIVALCMEVGDTSFLYLCSNNICFAIYTYRHTHDSINWRDFLLTHTLVPTAALNVWPIGHI